MSEFSAVELQILRNCELLKDISDKNFETYINLSRKIEFAKGDVLFEEGEVSDHVYIIITGKVQLYKWNNQKQYLIGSLSDGQSIGEMRIIRNQPCTLTVMAIQPTIVLSTPLRRLRHLNYNQCYESILDAVISILSNRLIHTNFLAISGTTPQQARRKKIFWGIMIITLALFFTEISVAFYYFFF